MAQQQAADVFLPFTVDALRDAQCAQLAPELRRTWCALAENLQVVVAVFYDDLASRLRGVYKEHPSRRTVQQQLYFLDGLRQLFDAAQYTALTQQEYDVSQQAQYEFTFPSDVQWSQICPEFLGRWYAARFGGGYLAPGERMPEFARRLLINVRGVETVEKTGLFIPEKLNLLCEVLWAKLSRCAGAASPRRAAAPPGGSARYRRVTLEDTCRQQGLLNVFFRSLTIVEPCFRSVIVCYHKAPPVQAKPAEKVPVDAPVLTTSQKHLQLHLFDSVPFGDLDAVFPCKTVDLRPFDRFQFAIYTAVAVVTVLLSASVVSHEDHKAEDAAGEEEAGLSHVGSGVMLLAVIVATGAAKQAYALYVAYTNLKAHYMNEVDSFVRSHTVASGLPVVSQLADDVKEQELKELLLGYYFLWVRAGSGWMSTDAVEAEVTQLLRDGLQLRQVNFDVDDSLGKLESLGLVERDPSQPATVAAQELRFRVARTPAQWLAERRTDHISPPNLLLHRA